MILATLACACFFGFGQVKKPIATKPTKAQLDSIKMKAAATKTVATTKATTTAVTTTDKYKDNVDDRMKGPKGEKVYIGPNGGRYYLSAAGNKVYVPYAGNKKPVAKP